MWEPRTYNKSFFDDMLEMSLEYFGPENDVCNAEFATHQYYGNPSGNALIELAVDPANEVLAGQYVVQPQRFRCFGQEVPCVLSFNTLTRESYRGQNIFTRLAERTYTRAASEGYAFVYGCPNRNSYPGFMKKLSFRDIHHFPLYIRPLDPSNMVKERTGNSILAGIAKPFVVFFPNKSTDDRGIKKLTEKNYKLMNSFWNRIMDKYPIMGIRNAEYIHYRYLNVPRRIYHPFVAMENGQIVAFAVGRIREVAGFQTGMIADFLFVSGHEKQAKKLVKVLVKRMKEQGASLAGCIMLAHTEEAKILKKCGFYQVPERILPQPTPLILRTLDKCKDAEKLMDIHNWFFTTGDYDVV